MNDLPTPPAVVVGVDGFGDVASAVVDEISGPYSLIVVLRRSRLYLNTSYCVAR